MRHTYTIDVSSDFSMLVSGRSNADGPYNAHAVFKLVQQKVRVYGHANLLFEGMLSVGSSFLHEMAKLIVEHDIVNRVTVICNDKNSPVKDKYNKYIKELTSA